MIIALKTINYRLLVCIFLTLLIPSIYQTGRIFFLGALPSSSGVDIASQLQWVNLFYEVIQEALIPPLFYLLGKSITSKSELENKVKTGLLITGIMYSLISILIIIFARPLLDFMGQDSSLIDSSVTYIRLETISLLFQTLWKFMITVLVTLKRDIYLYIALIIQMVLSISLDALFLSNLPFSLKLGVNGIAYSNIIVNILILIVSLFLIRKENINIFSKNKLDFSWLKEWLSLSKYSGLESLVRNLAFMLMIVRMVNLVSEQGNYWISNNFIYQWLLLPSLALADLVKQEIAEDKNNIQNKTYGYIILCSIFALVWLLSIPFWKPFLRYVMNVQDYQTVFNIVLIETGFYLTYLFNNAIFDSTFYGLGKTNYMLIQSLFVNLIYYSICFVLYLTGVFVPTLLGICLMFGIGVLLDFIPTSILYVYYLKKNNIKINFYNNRLS